MDVTKFTLASYSILPFDHVVIRLECEDPGRTDELIDYCYSLFPRAQIYSNRSDTALKYFTHLKDLERYDNPWIFFAPNNDHPFIGVNPAVLPKVLSDAEIIERNGGSRVSIPYSHFTETLNSVSPTRALWGSYEFIFPRLLEERDDSFVISLNKYLCDSIHIFRLNELLSIFQNTKNGGRVIRLEDTEFYLCNQLQNTLIVPKTEICRHFDGYFHRDCWPSFDKAPPPLFIPDGFFERDVKIRFGYSDYKEGWINIDPHAPYLKYFNSQGPDLNCALGDIPLVFRNWARTIDSNDSFDSRGCEANLSRVRYELIDPWRNRYFINFLFSVGRFLFSPVSYRFIALRRGLYKRYGCNRFYKLARSIWRSVCFPSD